MKMLLLVLVCAVALEAQTNAKLPARDKLSMRMVLKVGDPFLAEVTEVRSFAREKVGFGKTPPMYQVSVAGPKANYSIYCINAAPVTAGTYSVHIDYMDGSLSFLKLWPEAKKNLGLPKGESTRGMAYRMMVFHNFRDDPRMPPDIACDIKTETARR